jgi:anaphase-promoting complex subunit 3
MLRSKSIGEVEGAEILANSLYQLGEELELSQLGSRVLGEKKTSGVVWGVLGSVFSLVKEHEAAIKMLRRGIQISPYRSTLYSMLGYEYVAREKLDKAQEALTKALELNPRNYAALWLAGNIAINQEEWQTGYSYLSRAVEVNGRHQGLKVSLGECCVGLGMKAEARLLFEAVGGGTAGILGLFEKGKLDYEEQKYSKAKEALEKAKILAPREAGIHFLLAKTYARLREDGGKIICAFDAALELSRDTKETAHIKATMESMGVGITAGRRINLMTGAKSGMVTRAVAAGAGGRRLSGGVRNSVSRQ